MYLILLHTHSILLVFYQDQRLGTRLRTKYMCREGATAQEQRTDRYDNTDIRDYKVDNGGYICTAICCTGARHLFSSSNLAMKLYIACMREDKIHYLINLKSGSLVLRPSSFLPLVFNHVQWKVWNRARLQVVRCKQLRTSKLIKVHDDIICSIKTSSCTLEVGYAWRQQL